MAKATKTDQIIFRVTPAKTEDFKELAKEKGFANLSELVLAALGEYEKKHRDHVREMHRIAAEMMRFLKQASQQETNHEKELIKNAMQASIDMFKQLPTWSDAYLRDFENL